MSCKKYLERGLLGGVGICSQCPNCQTESCGVTVECLYFSSFFFTNSLFSLLQVECKKAQPKEVMTPTGSARGRSRVMPYGMDAFMLGIGMLGKGLNKQQMQYLKKITVNQVLALTDTIFLYEDRNNRLCKYVCVA